MMEINSIAAPSYTSNRTLSSARFPYPDALRGLGIVFVVAIHAFGYLHLPMSGMWNLVWLSVSLIAVPSFFLADGWLYAMHHRLPLGLSGAATSMAKSSQRLIVPWVIFSALYLCVGLLGQRMQISGGRPLLPNGIVELPSAFWRGAAATQLYFLPALFLVRLCTLALYPFVRGRPLLSMFLAFSALAGWKLGLEPILSHPIEGTDPLLAAGFGVGFAALGWCLAEAELANFPSDICVLIAAFLAVSALFSNGVVAVMLGQWAYLLTAWWLARSFVKARLHKWAARIGLHTMEIYLLHMPIVISLVSSALLLLRVPGPAAMLIDIAATLVCSLWLASCIRAIFPAGFASLLGVTTSAREWREAALPSAPSGIARRSQRHSTL